MGVDTDTYTDTLILRKSVLQNSELRKSELWNSELRNSEHSENSGSGIAEFRTSSSGLQRK
jgi:hypothetical protein